MTVFSDIRRRAALVICPDLSMDRPERVSSEAVASLPFKTGRDGCPAAAVIPTSRRSSAARWDVTVPYLFFALGVAASVGIWIGFFKLLGVL